MFSVNRIIKKYVLRMVFVSLKEEEEVNCERFSKFRVLTVSNLY